jgi:hypothetical protein
MNDEAASGRSGAGNRSIVRHLPADHGYRIAVAPGIPLLIEHFKSVPHIETLVPMLITVPAVLGGVLASGSWRGPFLLYMLAIPMFFAVLLFLWEPERPTLAAVRTAPVTPFPWSTMSIIFAITLFASLMYFSYPVNIAKALRDLGVDSSTRVGVLTAIASLGTPLGAAFIGIAGAAIVTWTLSCLPAEHRGRGMGFWSTFLVAGIFLSPMAFGLIAGHTGGVAPGFRLLGAACVIAAILIGRSRRLRTLG